MQPLARPFAAVIGAALLSGPVLSATAPTPASRGAPVPESDDAFCVRVQHRLAGTKLVPRNTVYDDYQAFRESKTSARPLTSHQFVLRDPASHAPLRVSCKIKTPDHLNAEYGPGSAEDRGLSCADINRDTVRKVYASLGDDGRRQLRIPEDRIVLDPDDTKYTGSGWVGAYPFAYTGADGLLHLQAKALRVDWDNIWFAWAPDKLRGAWYCHLVAPEYLRRLVMGAEKAPPAS